MGGGVWEGVYVGGMDNEIHVDTRLLSLRDTSNTENV